MVGEGCIYWCRKPLRGGLFAHVVRVGDRLGRAAAAAGPISGVLCGSAAGSLAEEWIRALRVSSTRVPNPVGSAQPATSVAGPSFAGRSGHDGGTLAATPRRSAALRPPPLPPTEPPPTEPSPTEPRTPATLCVWPCRLYVACSVGSTAFTFRDAMVDRTGCAARNRLRRTESGPTRLFGSDAQNRVGTRRLIGSDRSDPGRRPELPTSDPGRLPTTDRVCRGPTLGILISVPTRKISSDAQNRVASFSELRVVM